MITVLVIGAGNIGSLIACLLAASKDYTVHLAVLDLTKLDPKINWGTHLPLAQGIKFYEPR